MAILVVDDSRAMRLIVRRELGRAGYNDVIEAESGSAALTAVSAGGVDLVLSDWNRPDLNGIELLTALRARGEEVVFGFITSESSADVWARAFEAGASFLLTKPFTSEDLDREIMKALGGGALLAPTPPVSRTLDGVLSGLLGVDVSVTPSPAPRRDHSRAVAEYELGGTGGTVYAVVEFALAAGLACALARIPAAEARRWARAHAFDDDMESNFSEVANVLAAFASPSGERCVLRAVHALVEGELGRDMRHGEWRMTHLVDVQDYPCGRLGFLTSDRAGFGPPKAETGLGPRAG